MIFADVLPFDPDERAHRIVRPVIKHIQDSLDTVRDTIETTKDAVADSLAQSQVILENAGQNEASLLLPIGVVAVALGACLYLAHYNGLAYLDSHNRIQDAGVNDNVYAVWYDKPGGSIWIGTEHHLLCQSKSTGEIKTISSGSTFNQIVPSPSGDILLASEFGLKILNPKLGSIHTIGHDASAPHKGLPISTRYSVRSRLFG